MNISAAIQAVTEGKRVKLPEWQGFWFSSNNEVKMFSGNGDLHDPQYPKYENRTDFEITDGSLGFDFALRALRSGKRVARQGWNGKAMFLEIMDYTEGTMHKEWPMLPWIGMKTADGKFVPWLASQTDMLALDWVIIGKA